jgi:CheY-like chemotaxis protein
MSETKKLLIVDDSPTSRQIIRNHITRHRKVWQLYESDNGHDAMDMIRMVMPNYVTMDVNMPNMSGIEAAELILREYPHIRITLITANVQDAVRNRASELGIGFVEKPIKEESVIRAIGILEGVSA